MSVHAAIEFEAERATLEKGRPLEKCDDDEIGRGGGLRGGTRPLKLLPSGSILTRSKPDRCWSVVFRWLLLT